MTDFQTISEIVNESVRSSSYVTVVISSCVFIIYTLIIKIVDYFKTKSKNKPLIEMATAIKENTANIVKLNSVLDKTLQEAERKQVRQCEVAIEFGFKSMGYRIMQDCSSVIAHNNIDTNRNLITENLKKLVSNEYYKLYSTLSLYEIHEVNVASKLKEEWISEISDNIISIIYNGQDAVNRITQLSSRINIYVSEYSTYINNNIFNT